jgi:hypothetical protein
MWLSPRRQSWLFIPPVPIVLVVLVVASTGTEDTAGVSVKVQFFCWAMLKEQSLFGADMPKHLPIRTILTWRELERGRRHDEFSKRFNARNQYLCGEFFVDDNHPEPALGFA